MGLARAGHTRALVHYLADTDRFAQRLRTWREQLVEELQYDLSGHVGRKHKVLAERLSAIDEETLLGQLPLEAYLRPVVTPPMEREQHWRPLTISEAVNFGRGTLAGAAEVCERYFEWGQPDLVVRRFAAKNSVFSAAIVSSALKSETLSESAVVRVHDIKPSKLDTGYRDVRVDCNWAAYEDQCRSAMVGSRPDPSTLPPEMRRELGLVEVARPAAAQSSAAASRVTLPEYLVRKAWPTVLDVYEKEQAERAASKGEKGKAKSTKPKKQTIKDSGNMNIRHFMTQMSSSQARPHPAVVPEPSSVSPPIESVSRPTGVARSPVPSIFSESPPPRRRGSQPSPVPTSPSPPPVETSFSPSPPPSSRRRDQPRLFLTDSEGSDLEAESERRTARDSVQERGTQRVPGHEPEPEPESDHDDSVVVIESSALQASIPLLSPSKRGRRAGSKNSSSRSTTPVPKRSAASFTRAGSTGEGTKDDPISLSDSDDEDQFPMLRAAPSKGARPTRSTAAPKSPSAASKPRSRATASKSPPKPRSPPKTKKTTPLAASAAPAEQQTLLQGFFKPTAKVGGAAASASKPKAKPRKEKKEKYRVEEKDGVEVYHFL